MTYYLYGVLSSFSDKTQVFHDQIEAKQKELKPWAAQVNVKQAEIDVAVSERNTLAEKAEAVKNACKEAQENLEQLQTTHQSKVSIAMFAADKWLTVADGHL